MTPSKRVRNENMCKALAGRATTERHANGGAALEDRVRPADHAVGGLYPARAVLAALRIWP